MSESDPFAKKKKKETVEGVTSGNVISLREAENSRPNIESAMLLGPSA